MSIDFKELKELIAAIASTDIAELNLKSDDFELNVRKDAPRVISAESLVTLSTPSVVNSTPINTHTEHGNAPANTPVDKKWVEIKSPMVGTFYRAPAPDEPPFISMGDRIPVGQTVCIIEAMKLMNEIESEVAGQVMEILVENGQPVEFGQVLMYINPG